MAVFVELVTDDLEDLFGNRFADLTEGGGGPQSSRAGKVRVRRPHRGVEIKEDTYAMIRVIQADGKHVPLYDNSHTGGRTRSGYASFLLQGAMESRMEKHQLVETFGDSYVYFFGESPRFIDFQAILLNTHDFNWEAEWWKNYDEYIRGSRLVENGARCYMFFDDTILEGYVVESKAQKDASNPHRVNMSFRMFVTNYANISYVNTDEFPVRDSVVLPPNVTLRDTNAAQKIVEAYRGASRQQAEAENDYNGVAVDNILNNPIPTERKLSAALYSAGRSVGVSASSWASILALELDDQKKFTDLIYRTGTPIRGKISDNQDEFTGQEPVRPIYNFDGSVNPPPAQVGTVLDNFDVQDLFLQAVEFLTCFGADVNNPQTLDSMGLQPNVRPGTGRRFFSDRVTWNPLGGNQNRRYQDPQGQTIRDTANNLRNGYDAFARDPLESVYGPTKFNVGSFAQNLNDRSKYTEGAGDPNYGYPSDFTNGRPGFGQAGFGDFGGNGFGSGQGASGDPGLKDPSRFTYAGVASEQSAYQRFLKPRQDNTALTPGGGLGLGNGGNTGGASFGVSGKVSAFSFVSVVGRLDPTGNARQSLDNIRRIQEEQKLGLSNNNPYGVQCPNGPQNPLSISEGFSDSWSDGFNYTLP